MPSTPFRVLLVDNFGPWRRSVRSLLQNYAQLHVVGEAAEGLKAIQDAEELDPDLVLLDIGLSDLNGIEAAKRIFQMLPATKILFLSAKSEAGIVQAALDTGASGYVLKMDAGQELWPAISSVLQGEKFISSSLCQIDPTCYSQT
jgi:DNA-binding NarL/FixJ family response regulator